MTYLPDATHRLFARQHGVASLDQLLACGLTRGQIEHLVANGALHNVMRGCYGSPSVPLTEASRCAAISVARLDVVVAGPTAGRLWGLRRLGDDRRIHVLAPPGSKPAAAEHVVVFRTDAIRPSDVVQRPDGIRVASRARTALDLARFRSGDDLLSIIEQVMHDGRLDLDAMREVASGWLHRRPWVRRYLAQVDRVGPGAPVESHAELRVKLALERSGVGGLVSQYEIAPTGHRRIRFDLAVPDLCWAVEVDVFPTHAEHAGRLADQRRDDAARREGWAVFRISADAYANRFSRSIADAVRHHAAVRRAASA